MPDPLPPGQHFTADWFTGNAQNWLAELGHLAGQPTAALEVGSFEGRSACWLLENLLTHPKSTLVCVDTWDGNDPILRGRAKEAERYFDHNVGPFGKRALKFKSDSAVALCRFLGMTDFTFDLIFVDGSHEGIDALTDLVLAWRLLRPGGALVFDDYLWEGKGLRAQPSDAWDAFASVRPAGLTWRVVGRQVFARKGAP